jgi:hypothetical protein
MGGIKPVVVCWLDGQAINNLAPMPVMLLERPRTKEDAHGGAGTCEHTLGKGHQRRLSVTALIEYLHLWDQLEAVRLNPHQEDVVQWKCTLDGWYSARSASAAPRPRSLPRVECKKNDT